MALHSSEDGYTLIVGLVVHHTKEIEMAILGRRSYGARVPEHLAWSVGKTAASVVFVKHTLRYLEVHQSGLTKKQIETLTEAVRLVKSGQLVFTDWIEPDEYLTRNP